MENHRRDVGEQEFEVSEESEHLFMRYSPKMVKGCKIIPVLKWSGDDVILVRVRKVNPRTGEEETLPPEQYYDLLENFYGGL